MKNTSCRIYVFVVCGDNSSGVWLCGLASTRQQAVAADQEHTQDIWLSLPQNILAPHTRASGTSLPAHTSRPTDTFPSIFFRDEQEGSTCCMIPLLHTYTSSEGRAKPYTGMCISDTTAVLSCVPRGSERTGMHEKSTRCTAVILNLRLERASPTGRQVKWGTTAAAAAAAV